MAARVESRPPIPVDLPALDPAPSTNQHERQHTMTDTDHDAMNAAIRGHAPKHDDEQDDEQEQAVPSFDGGARTTAPRALDMNAILRGKVDRWHRGE
jgi:hypothetical protein